MSNIFTALDARRSRYGLDKASKLSNEEVTALVERAVQATPSAFNAQTQRVVVLFGENSDKFWDITREELRKVAPAEGFENTIAKLESFKAGQGTILYFIDDAVVTGLQEQFALYADNFPIWAQQENGMLQLVTWTALSEAGLGATVQHYNPVVDAATATAFDLPSTWKLVAQMPFGNPVGDVNPKELAPVSDKVKVF
ncbi:nitroreductase family protein [Erysipelothrix sp. HDW6C]|uniref:nitroreductase family protein n=1 Tax=Erysipelothrix sp. HDW6C TaxID=2714930 RepID=UPI001407C3EA|nr:nitroreductase family protein [Erysipelothrix sp. HDW6C]QIK70470.1 nitroreductase family protein [Erysipelothrix sp. HDW6C]